MLTELDKDILNSIDVAAIEQLISELEGFIAQADQLLKTFPEVTFANAHETALHQTKNADMNLKEWDQKVWEMFLRTFGENRPSAQNSFNYASVLAPKAISAYGDVIVKLNKKRDILVEFKKDLDKYLGK